MTEPIAMPELVRPNGVDGLHHYVETCYDQDTDSIVVSQVHFWVRFMHDSTSLSVKRVTLSDGIIAEAGAPDPQAAWVATKNLSTDPTKTAEDLVRQMVGLDWGRAILRQAYGL
jgi:hypothetical protein